MTQKYAVARLKAAYEANGITWDEKLNTLDADTALDNALYWEARSKGQNPYIGLTLRQAERRLREVAGPAPSRTRACRRIAAASDAYHGSPRE